MILITGTPGTGKRSVGAFLATQHDFRHLDLVGAPTGLDSLRLLLAALAEAGGRDVGVVVTCSSGLPAECLELLRALDAEWVWFDGDRGAARPETVVGWKFEGESAEPRFVDPFEADGSFRPVASVATDLLAGEPREQSPPVATGGHQTYDRRGGFGPNRGVSSTGA